MFSDYASGRRPAFPHHDQCRQTKSAGPRACLTAKVVIIFFNYVPLLLCFQGLLQVGDVGGPDGRLQKGAQLLQVSDRLQLGLDTPVMGHG